MRLLVWVLFVFAAVCLASAQYEWPMERQDRYGTGRAPSGPPVESLCLPWISKVLSAGWPVSHGPSIRADGLAFYGDWVPNDVNAFDVATETIKRTFKAPNFITGTPALDDTHAFITTDNSEGRLIAIGTLNMQAKWFVPNQGIPGSAILGPDGTILTATVGGVVSRYKPIGGGVVWQRPGLGFSTGTPCFTRDDTKVLIGNGNSITALNWSDGSVAWTRDLGSQAGAPGTAPNGTVFIGCQAGTIYALNPSNGKVIWNRFTFGEVYTSPAFNVAGTVVYMGSFDTKLYAYNVDTGHLKWTFASNLWVNTPATVGANDLIYFHNKGGILYCLNPNGTERWEVDLGGESRGPLTIGPDGTLYVGFTGENSHSGLALVHQTPLATLPESMAVDIGTRIAGTLPSLFTADKMAVVVRRDGTVPMGSFAARLSTSQTMPYKELRSFSVSVVSKSSADGIVQMVELYSYADGKWHRFDSRSCSTSQQSMKIAIPDATGYVDLATGDVRCRLSYKVATGASVSTWRISIDRFVVDAIVPQLWR